MTLQTNTNKTLRDFEFSDLIIDLEGRNSFLKNLVGHKVDALIPVFDELMDDVSALAQKVKDSSRKEFAIKYDNIQYRVAKSRNDKIFFLRKGTNIIPSLKENGFQNAIINKLLNSKRNYGLLLFSGRQGSGKTRSASSFIHDKLSLHGGLAVTIEDPPEFPLNGKIGKGFCVQQEVSIEDVPQAIVEAMRLSSPDIIFLGELRESAVASEALRAALNGHLIVATIHASGIQETLERIAVLAKHRDGEVAYTLLEKGFFGVIHQQLKGDTLPRRLYTDFLFSSNSVQNMIRAKKIYQIGTEIIMQKNQMMCGKKGA